ncbi:MULTISPECIES: site-specific DNA-methyltransferase [Giesbergeria]|uniref:site-specific DNA-methyltransferase (adenine-specific) n=1 Tax=Giesbergeria sinuosa TaxID=80883 RepID=A0ABV9QGQ9_9BURK
MPTLNWIGKEAVTKHHKNVPFRLLEPVPELSCGPADAGNLIVQGDNLHALKALLPRYAGQVKCIYIDPPYNTGNEGWVYNDNVNSPEIRQWLGEVVGKEGETLDRHDRWLCMMYPRLVLLKQFLREDGAIFVSIDDNEVATLRLLMDEIFGGGNFIAQFEWQKAYSPRMDAKLVSWDTDHIVAYGKSTLASLNRLRFEQNNAQFTNIDLENGKKYRRRQWRKEGSGAKRADRPNLFYELTAPDGTPIMPIRPDGSEGRWRGQRSYYDELVVAGEIEWLKQSGVWQVYVKQYADSDATRPPSTWWPSDVYGHNHEAAEEIRNVLGVQAFSTPKPVRLVEHILQIATDKDSIVLDSFAGSGTTGHAVLKQNAEDGGQRRFILVEIDDHIAQNVTAERVKRVAEGYTNAKGQTVEGVGGGFQFCRLSTEPLFNADGQIRSDVTFAELAKFVWFSETQTGYTGQADSPLLGVHEGRAIYLLYNGILKDQSIGGGNVLTGPVFQVLPQFAGPKVVYAAANRLGTRTAREGITFKQTPYALEL